MNRPVGTRDSVRAVAALAALGERHYWREITVRTADCLDGHNHDGLSDDIGPYIEPDDSCFEQVRICNGCGTRESCGDEAVYDALGGRPR